ncbi:outer membrane protein assembly factor BamD [Apibacter raozihei]|uniref:outer membrane protein assembly factor BamD n=1 Tax=Apibacter TaxID=1778601 RepID=UPI0013E31909|nr:MULTISPECIES: outer membrane protein assembly factor BamD [Apibacter]
MKRLILIILPLVLLTSCERRLNQALKSDKKDFILKVAEEYEQKKKYTQAISLYDYAAKFVVGTDEAPEVAYRTANLNYRDGNFRLAAHQFKNFVVSYPKDRRVDEASYMAAYCYYSNSPDYNLDQTNTYDALRELQLYIDGHPNSDKVAYCNEMISDLNKKLEKKAFENAKTLYKITEYKAAIVSFDNVLEDFPDTKFKEDILIYSLRAKTELAVNSIHRLQEGRINDAVKSYEAFVKLYPSSEYSDEAKRLNNRLDNARDSFKNKEKLLNEANDKLDEKNKDLNKERKKIS